MDIDATSHATGVASSTSSPTPTLPAPATKAVAGRRRTAGRRHRRHLHRQRPAHRISTTSSQITRVRSETVPDRILRAADQIEVVDLAPQSLRDRLASGVVYPAERIDAALSNYFRLGNLTALRELALLWLADEVDRR
jgi:hypothetical protein